jgi:hypothetical protein
MAYAIIRGSNGRRHEVDFGAAPVRVEIFSSEETVEIFVEADLETLPEGRRRFAILNIPWHQFSEAAGGAAKRHAKTVGICISEPGRLTLQRPAISCCSWSRSHNAAGWNAGKPVRAPILRCQRVAIGSGGATCDAALLVPGMGGGFLPWSIIGHRTFDGEHTTVVVGHDEVERLAKIIPTRHGQTLHLAKSAVEGLTVTIRFGAPHLNLLSEPEEQCAQQHQADQFGSRWDASA